MKTTEKHKVCLRGEEERKIKKSQLLKVYSGRRGGDPKSKGGDNK